MHRTKRQTGICAAAVIAALMFSTAPSIFRPWPHPDIPSWHSKG